MVKLMRPALRQLHALHLSADRLDIGPHSRTLLDEVIKAGRAECWLSVIVLSAALVDVIAHEGAETDIAFDMDGEAEAGFGLSFLDRSERQALDRLRGFRNRILHHQGMTEGLGGTAQDKAFLADQAEASITALLPLLELQETYR